MLIRPITTIEECRKVAALERIVWAYPDSEDVVPPPILIVSIKRGGILLGAFDDAGELKGFVYSLPGVKDGRPIQWSHMLGVAPDARDSGLGLRLKLAQRDHALQMGIEIIEWTFDPLQALNAHLNFARLGVIVEEYEENIYGDSTSPLHSGTPTDRFVAEWRLTSPHVERRLAAPATSWLRDSAVMTAVLVNASRESPRGLAPGTPNLESLAERLLVEIPIGFTEMLLLDGGLALEWRMATRAIFKTYFARGYRVVDFFLSRDAARGQYLLAPRPK
jgi:predicted GNAT superfamily acetyltransferase